MAGATDVLAFFGTCASSHRPKEAKEFGVVEVSMLQKDPLQATADKSLFAKGNLVEICLAADVWR